MLILASGACRAHPEWGSSPAPGRSMAFSRTAGFGAQPALAWRSTNAGNCPLRPMRQGRSGDQPGAERFNLRSAARRPRAQRSIGEDVSGFRPRSRSHAAKPSLRRVLKRSRPRPLQGLQNSRRAPLKRQASEFVERIITARLRELYRARTVGASCQLPQFSLLRLGERSLAILV
jgi:hypothetical protein